MFYHWGLRRSTLVVSLLASFALAQPPWRDPVPVGGGWASPEYKWLFEFPLPLPPVKQEKWPDKPIYSPATGERIRYYEMEVSQFQKQIYPNLPPTTFVGYDGVLPAPAFIAERGSQSVVRLTNRGPKTSSIHLHGAFSRAPFDGWADDIVQPGQFKDYFWPNLQNGRTIWYHDHVLRHTAENAYFGQVGAYIIHDPAEDALGLPSGKYDIILAISSKVS
ncbi:hypothetical protein VTK73DRAFT_9740 [Phialemonium thermophilum]|uniref:Plastocyanin-like domain-containing protein n=1 Tax=Phialemonium thermophilum TaxID=223376 RepID=A0ABR3W0N1_9PEZI